MTLPAHLRPSFTMRTGESPSFWSVMHDVNALLKTSGFPDHANVFRSRAMELNQNTDDDFTDLLALVHEYVELTVVREDP